MRLDEAARYAAVPVSEIVEAIEHGQLRARSQPFEPGGWLLNPELVENWAAGTAAPDTPPLRR
ncbi:MAG: hypothetical protein QOI54_252 [Actinomycetota bacterium]|jgi:hypothetical protein|nr:hypothetical protein [Actinomycetota bacterium]